MEWVMPCIIVVISLFGVLATGVPIAFGMGLIGVFGLLIIRGTPGLFGIPIWIFGAMNNFTLVAVPLFIFLAEVLDFTGITRDLFDVLRHFLRKIPGSLALSSVLGSAVFAAVSGSSMATAAVMGRIAVPEMLRSAYDKRLALGSVAVGGTLGILIPPSIPMIIMGSIADISVARLFMGGIIPGILLAFGLCIPILLFSCYKSNLAPAPLVSERKSTRQLIFLVARTWPFAMLIIGIIGSIYCGVATPTEAAGVGCVLALMIAFAFRRLKWKTLKPALLRTVETTAFIMFILAAVTVFTRMTSIIGIPEGLASLVKQTNLSKWTVLLLMCLIYFVLGMFVDSISIILITLPIFVPIIKNLGFDPVWFGVMVVITLEFGLITPPVGMNAYVLQGIVAEEGISLETVFQGIMPFIPIFLVVLLILTIFPGIVLWLPNSLFAR